MAGVEQATAPGAAAPDASPEPATTPETRPADRPAGDPPANTEAEPTTRAGRRAARRRSSQKSSQKPGRQSDAPEDRKPTEPTAEDDGRPTGQHAAEDDDSDASTPVSLVKPGRHAHRSDEEQTGTPTAGSTPTPGSTGSTGSASSTGSTDTAGSTPTPGSTGTTGSAGSTSTAGSASVAGRPPRSAGPAHAGTPSYRPRHAKRNRRRWPVLLAAGLVLVALAGVGAAALVSRQDDGTDGATAPAATNIAPAPANLPTGPSEAASASAPPPAAAAPGTADCRFAVAPDKTPQFVPPARATRSGLVRATIGTSRGPIALELDATNAPCTVESFLTLAAGGFYNDTACHRLTTMLIFVLQCGDPTALGSGDPGYSFDDENLPAPGGTPYPRGTLAMANAGPDTNGSQFFIVYKDSPIDPNYPVFGRVTAGLEIIDRVAAGGAPGNDGQPNESIVIQAVQIS